MRGEKGVRERCVSSGGQERTVTGRPGCGSAVPPHSHTATQPHFHSNSRSAATNRFTAMNGERYRVDLI